jgi:uncharacterized protein YhaN
MRLARLDLTRYGKFTEHTIDFGLRPQGKPDLHIIYGPNEAGKSTALSAFLDLLFGVETQSPYDFLHSYATMQIGAALELEGGLRELVRVKRSQNSLRDDKGQTISETALLRDLGGLERDSYRTMFSLDDETLEAGGKSILASKGDLGQLLFSATAGLADLSQTLSDLQEEAHGFYRYRARSGELLTLKNQLASLKARKDEIDTLASTYAQLIEKRDWASAQYEEAVGESRTIRTRIEEIQRRLNALPRLAALRAIRGELAPLAELPDAPEGWRRDLPVLQREDTEFATRQQGFDDDIHRLRNEIDAIALDEIALNLAERFDRLAESRTRYDGAILDLASRRLEWKEADFEISSILRRLEREGEADPKALILGASTVGALRSLIEKRSGVETALESTQNELANAAQRFADARRKLEEAGGVDSAQQANPAVIALKTIVDAQRGSDHGARQRVAEKLRAGLLDALAERMAALAPWRDDAEALTRMIAPDPAEMEAWRTALAEAQKRSDRTVAEIGRLTNEQRRLTAEAAAIGGSLGLVDDGQAATIRAERERAWATHRRKLDAATADAFEDILRRDDIAASARLLHSSDAARLQQTKQALAGVEADLEGAQELRAANTADAAALREQIGAAIASMSPDLPNDFSVVQLKTWLDRREKALEARANLRKVERDLREAEADAAAARDKIREALTTAGAEYDPAGNFETLLMTAQTVIDRESQFKTMREHVVERRQDMERRQRDFDAAQGAERKWSAAWDEAIAKCWLGDSASHRDIAAVRETLAEIAALGPAIDKQAGLADRIEKMEADQQSFIHEVDAVATALGDAPNGEAQQRADAISNRIRQARSDQATRARKAGELEALQLRRGEVAVAIAANSKRKAEMTVLFGVASLNEVDVKLRQIMERASLRARAIEAERDILDAIGAPSVAAAEGILESADRSALEGELGELKVRIEDHDQRVHELSAARSKAKDAVEAIGGDDAVAKIEQERRTVLLDVEEKALNHFRLRAGIVAAEQALRLYRDKHRSAMMMRASEAFRIISRGAYVRLAAQPGKDGEVLIGVAANGRSKAAVDMSKGTRFQLYLALRVAGYEEFARSRGPVPFIADDIMETFDDFRAEEAFRVFAEMAEFGQVIYLTHHRHLCAIARSVCPDVKVHELSVGAAG